MVVRRLRADEGSAWRELRLRALADAPEAFATTYEEAIAWEPPVWDERARLLAEGRLQVMFVADDRGLLVGCAGAFLDEDDGGQPHLISMWVSPGARRIGVGVELTNAVVGWARAGGFASLRLFVVEGNASAAKLYRKCGFRVTGRTLPLPRSPTVIEREMRLQLD